MDKVRITRRDWVIDFEALLDPKTEKTGDDDTDILMIVFTCFCAILWKIKEKIQKNHGKEQRDKYDTLIISMHSAIDKISKFD